MKPPPEEMSEEDRYFSVRGGGQYEEDHCRRYQDRPKPLPSPDLNDGGSSAQCFTSIRAGRSQTSVPSIVVEPPPDPHDDYTYLEGFEKASGKTSSSQHHHPEAASFPQDLQQPSYPDDMELDSEFSHADRDYINPAHVMSSEHAHEPLDAFDHMNDPQTHDSQLYTSTAVPYKEHGWQFEDENDTYASHLPTFAYQPHVFRQAQVLNDSYHTPSAQSSFHQAMGDHQNSNLPGLSEYGVSQTYDTSSSLAGMPGLADGPIHTLSSRPNISSPNKSMYPIQSPPSLTVASPEAGETTSHPEPRTARRQTRSRASTNTSSKSRTRRELFPDERLQVAEMRKIGACDYCKAHKIKCGRRSVEAGNCLPPSQRPKPGRRTSAPPKMDPSHRSDGPSPSRSRTTSNVRPVFRLHPITERGHLPNTYPTIDHQASGDGQTGLAGNDFDLDGIGSEFDGFDFNAPFLSVAEDETENTARK